MQSIGSAAWGMLAVGVVLGAVLGAGVSWIWSRRRNAGRRAEDVQKDFDEYKQKVNEHFEKTSELFTDMTARYRDVYTHLATGAQELVSDAPEAVELDIVTYRLSTERAAGAGDDPVRDEQADERV